MMKVMKLMTSSSTTIQSSRRTMKGIMRGSGPRAVGPAVRCGRRGRQALVVVLRQPLLHRGEAEVVRREVVAPHGIHVTGVDQGRLVPDPWDRRSLLGELVVDFRPRVVAALADGLERGLRHRAVDGGVVELRPVYVALLEDVVA